MDKYILKKISILDKTTIEKVYTNGKKKRLTTEGLGIDDTVEKWRDYFYIPKNKIFEVEACTKIMKDIKFIIPHLNKNLFQFFYKNGV